VTILTSEFKPPFTYMPTYMIQPMHSVALTG